MIPEDHVHGPIPECLFLLSSSLGRDSYQEGSLQGTALGGLIRVEQLPCVVCASGHALLQSLRCCL